MINITELKLVELVDKIKEHTKYFHIYTFGGLTETNKWLKENNYA